ncbi:hypothetical protein GQ42DRAFT_160011 [Ramicandelaber brevisporus]|nr:hypothetical protein GQ42DRAFT_160011 [Ramicandelaber brevisporus]
MQKTQYQTGFAPLQQQQQQLQQRPQLHGQKSQLLEQTLRQNRLFLTGFNQNLTPLDVLANFAAAASSAAEAEAIAASCSGTSASTAQPQAPNMMVPTVCPQFPVVTNQPAVYSPRTQLQQQQQQQQHERQQPIVLQPATRPTVDGVQYQQQQQQQQQRQQLRPISLNPVPISPNSQQQQQQQHRLKSLYSTPEQSTVRQSQLIFGNPSSNPARPVPSNTHTRLAKYFEDVFASTPAKMKQKYNNVASTAISGNGLTAHDAHYCMPTPAGTSAATSRSTSQSQGSSNPNGSGQLRETDKPHDIIELPDANKQKTATCVTATTTTTNVDTTNATATTTATTTTTTTNTTTTSNTKAEARRQRVVWSNEEIDAVFEGVQKYGVGGWKHIRVTPEFRDRFHPGRLSTDFKDVFKRRWPLVYNDMYRKMEVITPDAKAGILYKLRSMAGPYADKWYGDNVVFFMYEGRKSDTGKDESED